jgi:hypothetical protein
MVENGQGGGTFYRPGEGVEWTGGRWSPAARWTSMARWFHALKQHRGEGKPGGVERGCGPDEELEG